MCVCLCPTPTAFPTGPSPRPRCVCVCVCVLHSPGFLVASCFGLCVFDIGGDWAWSCDYWDRPTRIKAKQFPRWTLALASQKNRRWHTTFIIIDIPFP